VTQVAQEQFCGTNVTLFITIANELIGCDPGNGEGCPDCTHGSLGEP
jgi:hypothetical protein